jgi:phosphoglycerate-specific signal transduction histidine kinase
LRGRLLLAFAGISSFAVLAAIAGFFTFIVGRQALEDMTGTRVPRALEAMELLRHSERLVASGPALLNAANADEIGNEIAAKNAELASIRRLLADLRAADYLAPMVTEIEVTIDSLAGDLDDIGTAATQRVQATSYKTALLRNAYGAARAFAKIWSARFETVQKQVVELERTAAQNADPRRLDEIDQAMLAMLPLDRLQRRAADSFQTLVGAAETEDPNELARLKTNSEDALRDIEGLVSGVDLDTSTALFPHLKQLADASLGPGGLFAVKEIELKATADGRRLIEENRRLANRMSDAVQAFVDTSRRQMQASADGAARIQTVAGGALAAIALLSLISSVLIVWLYVGRNIVNRLSGLSAGLAAIAAGRRDIAVDRSGADEIAAMGRAVEVLRQNAAERDALLIERAGTAERLERQVEERTVELRDALHQQLATAEVLRVINNSPGNMTPVFETVLEKAGQLCDIDSGILWVYNGARFHPAAYRAVPSAYRDYVEDPAEEAPIFTDLRRGKDVVHVPDLAASSACQTGNGCVAP